MTSPHPLPSLPDRSSGTAVQSPPWLASLERSVGWISQEGAIHLRPGTTFSEGQRAALREQVRRLRISLQPGSALEIGREVAVMLGAFPMLGLSDDALDQRSAAYLYALDTFPGWAVKEAVRWWIRGERSEPGDRHGFAPSPPQLVRLAKLALEPTEAEILRLTRMAEAVVDAPTGAKPAPPQDGTITWDQAGTGPVTSRWEGERREGKREVVPLTDAELRARLAGTEPAKGRLEASAELLAILADEQKREVA